MIRTTTASQLAKVEFDELSVKLWHLRFAGRAVFLLTTAVLGMLAARYGQ